MISKKIAYNISKKYLEDKKIKFTSLDSEKQISFHANRRIPFGKREGEFSDMYSLSFYKYWGNEEKLLGIYLDAKSGEVLFIITPTDYFLY